MIIGIERLVLDLEALEYNVTRMKDSNNLEYAVINGFIIPAGSFAGQVINLAIPVPTDYPRSLGASIHIHPHITPMGHHPGYRNVIESPLGNQWQYWSFRFTARPANPTTELMCQINEAFRKN